MIDPTTLAQGFMVVAVIVSSIGGLALNISPDPIWFNIAIFAASSAAVVVTLARGR